MKITDIETRTVSIPLNQTFKTALRSVDQIENVCLCIRTDSEVSGYGGAAPTAVITGETVSSILGAIEHIKENIRGLEVENFDVLMQKLNSCIVGNSSAKAAVDMALYDLFCKQIHLPLYGLLGGYSSPVETDMTISIDTHEKMSSDSRKALDDGFSILKIKVGNDPELDYLRLKTIWSAVGSSVKLRIDANQGWKPKDAVNIMARLDRENINIELLEQPVFASDFVGMRFVRDNVNVPVIADESVFSPEDAMRILDMRAVDGINIKLMKCGGIYNALKIAALAESAGVSCMIGSMMESAVSVSAAVHMAKATRFDLDAPLFCSKDPSDGAVKYQGSSVSVRDFPGLGMGNMDMFTC